MSPTDLHFWLHGQPFRPFRIIMKSGRTYEVCHPELVRVMPTGIIYFTPSDQEDVYERAEMIGMLLIDKIEPVATHQTTEEA
jgi:hypothetical protein